MPVKRPTDVLPSEITPRAVYARRREIMKLAAAGALLGAAGLVVPRSRAQPAGSQKLENLRKSAFSTTEPLNSFKDITTYNNFYEFGTDKYSPARLARNLRTRPWTVKVEGEVKRPRTYDVDDLLKLAPLEERIYRLRRDGDGPALAGSLTLDRLDYGIGTGEWSDTRWLGTDVKVDFSAGLTATK